MTVKNITSNDIATEWKGEIFIKAVNQEVFNSIKSFIDNNHLICFIESENKIYAQGHDYCGISVSQANQIAQITSIQNSIDNIIDKLELTDNDKSIIGALTYTVEEDGVSRVLQAPNVTSFVNTVIAAVQSGSINFAQDLEDIESRVDDIENLLEGFPNSNNGNPENVKEYVDRQITTVVSQLALAIASNATIVEGDNNHINVTYEATVDERDPVTNDPISYKPPYVFRVTGYDIASASSLNELTSKINTLLGNTGDKSIKQIIDEEIAAQLIPENASEALDTLQEIANWIQEHPNSVTAINSALTSLRTDLNDLTTEYEEDKETFALKGELYESDGEGGTRLKTTENGQEYATTLEELNVLIGHMSFAQNVEDNAEQNVINAIDVNEQKFKLNGTDIEFDIGNDETSDLVQFINANYEPSNRTISLDINTDAFEQIANLVLSTSINSAVQESKSYTDQKLSWIITD